VLLKNLSFAVKEWFNDPVAHHLVFTIVWTFLKNQIYFCPYFRFMKVVWHFLSIRFCSFIGIIQFLSEKNITRKKSLNHLKSICMVGGSLAQISKFQNFKVANFKISVSKFQISKL
jgi:hypothetical protein